MADNRLHFLEVAKQNLDKDLVPLEDALACAGTVNAIHKKAFGEEIGGGLSTYQMYQILKIDPRFEKTLSPLPGDVCISPTGMGDSKKIRNGHVGIVMEGEKIASNNSLSGLFEINYSFASWRKRWVGAKYPMDFFRVVTPPSYEVYKPTPVLVPIEEKKPTTLIPAWLRLFLDRQALGAVRSPGWRELQQITIKDHPFCSFHGGKGTLLNPLNVHHLKNFSAFPELELIATNLLVACRFCHFWYCHRGSWKKLNPTAKEDASYMLSKVVK